jgi:hypothetical protein
VPARPHLDLDAVVDQEVPVPEDVVDRGDLEVHVAQPGPVALEDGQLVVHGVDPHEARRIADPVGHLRVEGAGPEPVGLVDVRRVEAQVTEAGDPRRTPEGDRPGEGLLLRHQFEPVAERVVERDAGTDPARPRGRGVETPDREAATFELALRTRQAPSSATVKPDAMTPDRPATSARQWWRASARRCATPCSSEATSSSPTISVAKRTAAGSSATPERT